MTDNELIKLSGGEFYAEDIKRLKNLAPDKTRYNLRPDRRTTNSSIIRKLTQYRKWKHKEYALKKDISALNAIIAKSETLFNESSPRLTRRGKSLTDLWLELAEVQLRLRETEKFEQKLSPICRKIVHSRYLDSTKKRPPEWGETAKELGFPISGAELRYRVTDYLNKIS